MRSKAILILGGILAALIGPLLFSTWYTYKLQEEVHDQAFRVELEQEADFLASGMRDPVWNLIPDQGRPLLAAMLGSAEAAAAAKGVARRVQAAAVRPHFEEAEAALFAQLSTAVGGAAG